MTTVSSENKIPSQMEYANEGGEGWAGKRSEVHHNDFLRVMECMRE